MSQVGEGPHTDDKESFKHSKDKLYFFSYFQILENCAELW